MPKHIPAFRFHRSRQRGVSLLFALLALVALLLTTLALVRTVDTGTMVLGNVGFKQDATAAADQATRQALDWLAQIKAANTDPATTPLNNDDASNGYFASSFEYKPTDLPGAPSTAGPLDVTGRGFPTDNTRQLIDWDGDHCASAGAGSFASCTITPFRLADKINGNTASFVILRLCNKAGDPSADNTILCSASMAGGNGFSDSLARGGCDYADPLCGRYSNNAGSPGLGGGSSGSVNYRILARVQGARNTVSFTETIVHF
jgi:hypothetical protein